eukprot:94407_1
MASNLKAPNEGDWGRVKRMLKYLNGTKDKGITFSKCQAKEGSLKLETYAGASFATDKKRGRSITGYVTHFQNSPVYWKSHLQKTVADSPNAAEYMSIYEAAVATVFIRNLLKEMGIETPMATIHEDNDGTRRLAMNGMGQGKARHLMAKHH